MNRPWNNANPWNVVECMISANIEPLENFLLYSKLQCTMFLWGPYRQIDSHLGHLVWCSIPRWASRSERRLELSRRKLNQLPWMVRENTIPVYTHNTEIKATVTHIMNDSMTSKWFTITRKNYSPTTSIWKHCKLLQKDIVPPPPPTPKIVMH